MTVHMVEGYRYNAPKAVTRRAAASMLQDGWEVVQYLGVPKMFLRSPTGNPTTTVELPRDLAALVQAPEPIRLWQEWQEQRFVKACSTPGAFFYADMDTSKKTGKQHFRSEAEKAWNEDLDTKS